MLILTRKNKEGVLIEVDGTVIEVDVKRTSAGKVSLAFNAPPRVRIVRREVLEREDNK